MACETHGVLVLAHLSWPHHLSSCTLIFSSCVQRCHFYFSFAQPGRTHLGPFSVHSQLRFHFLHGSFSVPSPFTLSLLVCLLGLFSHQIVSSLRVQTVLYFLYQQCLAWYLSWCTQKIHNMYLFNKYKIRLHPTL